MSVILQDLETIQQLPFKIKQGLQIDKSIYFIDDRDTLQKCNSLDSEDCQLIAESVEQITTNGKQLLGINKNGDLWQYDNNQKLLIAGKNFVWITPVCGIDNCGKGFLWNSKFVSKMLYSHCKHVAVHGSRIVITTLGGKLMHNVDDSLVQINQINGLKINTYFKKAVLMAFGGIAITESGEAYCFGQKMIKLKGVSLQDIQQSSNYVFAVDGVTIHQWSIETLADHQFFSNPNIFQKLNSGNEISIPSKKMSFKDYKFINCYQNSPFVFGQLYHVPKQQNKFQISRNSQSLEQSVSVLERTFCRESLSSMKDKLFEGWGQSKQETLLSTKRSMPTSESRMKSQCDNSLEMVLNKINRFQAQDIQQFTLDLPKHNYTIQEEIETPISSNRPQINIDLFKQDKAESEPEPVQKKLQNIRLKLNLDQISLKSPEQETPVEVEEDNYSLYTLAEEGSEEFSQRGDNRISIQKHKVEPKIDQCQQKQYISDVSPKKVSPIQQSPVQVYAKVSPHKQSSSPVKENRQSFRSKLDKVNEHPILHEIVNYEIADCQSKNSPTFQSDKQKELKLPKSYISQDPQHKRKRTPMMDIPSEQQSMIDQHNGSGFLDTSFIKIWDNNNLESNNRIINRIELIKQKLQTQTSIDEQAQVKFPTEQTATFSFKPEIEIEYSSIKSQQVDLDDYKEVRFNRFIKKITTEEDPVIIGKKSQLKLVNNTSKSIIPPLNMSCRNSSQGAQISSRNEKSPKKLTLVAAQCKPYVAIKNVNTKQQGTALRKLVFRLDVRLKLHKLEFMFNLKCKTLK